MRPKNQPIWHILLTMICNVKNAELQMIITFEHVHMFSFRKKHWIHKKKIFHINPSCKTDPWPPYRLNLLYLSPSFTIISWLSLEFTYMWPTYLFRFSDFHAFLHHFGYLTLCTYLFFRFSFDSHETLQHG